jgi:peroxiredoxin
MIRRPVFFIFLLWSFGNLPGQSASIHAISPDYAGRSVHITIAWNPFIPFPQYSTDVTCGDEGEFEGLIPLPSARVVQFETGMYQAYLYMEAGFNYEVELPPYVEKEWDKRISPFYQPVSVPLKVLSRTSLSTGERIDGSYDVNHAIALFDSIFNRVNLEIISNRREGQNSPTDSIIMQLELHFSKDTSTFFSEYRHFRYGILKLNEGKTNPDKISHDYLGPTVMEWHPGFVELFRALFKDFTFYFSRTPEGQGFKNLVNRNQDFRQARLLIQQDPAVWSDTLADMVLLQELSVLFYQGEYHKEAILMMLDSIALDPVAPRFGVYAAQLKKKLSSLVTGHPPPSFTLKDLNGKSWSLEDFKGKYTYLFFGTTDHYGCMMEYPFLQSYVEKHSEYLNVVTVMISEDETKLEDFMDRNHYTWLVLHFNGLTGLLDDYMVRAYPTAYLIDRDGKLLLSPAILPSEGFEQQLFRIMRSRGEI